MRRAAVAVAVVLAAAGCAYTATDVAPEIPANAQSSKIYAADGTLIKTLHGPQNRIEVPLNAIPLVMQHAVVAIEDERFYEHNGVDLRAVLRAIKTNADTGELAQGGSTITQQLVKNTLLNSGKTLDRKIQEASLAWQLERHYSKDRILEIYLNTVYFGNGAYGVEAASETYFNRPVGQLEPAQAAMLAGIIQAPSDDDPLQHPDNALARRNVVLDKMFQQGYLDRPQHDWSIALPLGLEQPPPEGPYPAAHFVDEVIRFIENDPRFGSTPEKRDQLLYSGGLRIYTTVDLGLQAAAENAVAQTLTNPDTDPEAALVAVDPTTGYVKAMVGGRDYFGPQPWAKCNLAIGCKAQPGRGTGSAFKPFVLAAALQQGIPLTESLPAPGCIDLHPDSGPWHVCNADPGEGAPGGTNLIEGTVHSFNTLYAQLVLQVGTQQAIDMAARLGITTPLHSNPAAVLGTNDVTPLDMASAYGTFADHGLRVPPVLVTKITNADGTVIYQNTLAEKKVLEPRIADTVTTVLQQVIDRGTGTAAKLDRPAAGKTGTGEDYKNAWFCGYTPQLSTAVWVGFPQDEISMAPPTTRITVYGGTWPAQIWQRFMAAALSPSPPVDFRPPAPPTTTTTLAPVPPGPGEIRLGPEMPVPSVVGLANNDAEALLRSAGYRVLQVDADDGGPPGTVVRQAPFGGDPAPTGALVTLEVAPGGVVAPVVFDPPPPPLNIDTVYVPDVIGLSRDNAQTALNDAGLVVDAREVDAPRGVRHGRVFGSSPPAGALVARGATVTILIAR